MIFQKYSKILRYLIFFQLSCLLLGNKKLYLQKAKVLESKFLEGKNVKSISGDVVFTKGNLTLNCQEGLQYEKDGIAILFNEVSATYAIFIFLHVLSFLFYIGLHYLSYC